MIIDGRAIAVEIYDAIKREVSSCKIKPHLTVFTCAPNFETRKFLDLKKRKAEELGLGINVIEFPETASTEEMRLSMQYAFRQTDGVIVQLPFPPHIDSDSILKSIPVSLDVDAVHYDGTQSTVLPPVVGAIEEIARREQIPLADKKIVIVGRGRLVGAPAAKWFANLNIQAHVVTKNSQEKDRIIREADVLVLGAGVPGLVTPEMVKEGVIIFDAGTSETEGVLAGDADPKCAEKASFFTPVPGGIGPITVALLLKNVVALARSKA